MPTSTVRAHRVAVADQDDDVVVSVSAGHRRRRRSHGIRRGGPLRKTGPKRRSGGGVSPLARASAAAVAVVALLFVSVVPVVRAAHNQALLSHRAPLSYMSTPGNFYAIGFPPPNADDAANVNATTVNEWDPLSSDGDPEYLTSCGDGTPFSFLYKRGLGPPSVADRRFVVEFGDGPACYDGPSCSKML
eukprot:CAMPEP_0197437072 /NCGR_PEP_ID=MMETSP1175-20131217/4379_1 /TAXON_ID=1003142 /ORGANISM="Triceratium dubium, Strain CCMP147" /LENGTH=188 /DNA_ID=CAMNT_0042966503 /DNA_START=199 /DNA_END=761 /DNA_ORIENTATION=+